MIVAAFVLVACCAGPVLAGGAVLASVAGFVTGAWGLLALAAVLCAAALLVMRHRAKSSREDHSRA